MPYITISKNLKADPEALGIERAYNKLEFTHEELEQMLNTAKIELNEKICYSENKIKSNAKELSSISNYYLPEKVEADDSLIIKFGKIMFEYAQFRGGIFYQDWKLKSLMKEKAELTLEEIIKEAALVPQGFGCAKVIENLVKNLLIEKFSAICADFTATNHEGLISSTASGISRDVLRHEEKYLSRSNKLKSLNENSESHKNGIDYYKTKLAELTEHKSERLKEGSDRADKYKEYIEKNGYYTKSAVITALDTMSEEAFESAKLTGAIVTTCSFEKLQEETSFDAQLEALDLSKVEELVFCWANTNDNGNVFFHLPLDTCCVSNHPVVDHRATTDIKTLYADLHMGNVHLVKFNFHNKDMWEKLAKQLDGHKIKSIVDCADGGWSDKQAFHRPFTKEFIETTKYIQDNILEEDGKIMCSIQVKELQPFDFEAAYKASELNGEVSEVCYHD